MPILDLLKRNFFRKVQRLPNENYKPTGSIDTIVSGSDKPHVLYVEDRTLYFGRISHVGIFVDKEIGNILKDPWIPLRFEGVDTIRGQDVYQDISNSGSHFRQYPKEQKIVLEEEVAKVISFFGYANLLIVPTLDEAYQSLKSNPDYMFLDVITTKPQQFNPKHKEEILNMYGINTHYQGENGKNKTVITPHEVLLEIIRIKNLENRNRKVKPILILGPNKEEHDWIRLYEDRIDTNIPRIYTPINDFQLKSALRSYRKPSPDNYQQYIPEEKYAFRNA